MKKENNRKDNKDIQEVVVIGGGASGLFAAINIARSGKKVIIIEANDKPGKKILQTGNGRCNLTNMYFDTSMYNCDNKSFVDNIFGKFSVKETIEEFEKMGVLVKSPIIDAKSEEDARYTGIYPNSNQASTISESLISNCYINGIKIINNTIVSKIEKVNDIFKIYLENLEETSVMLAKKVLISVGTKAGVRENFTDGIVESVIAMGHKINKFLPGLCSIYADKKSKAFLKKVNGVRTEVKAELYIKDDFVKLAKGELQLCDYGLSGIVIFQLSALVSKAINNEEKVKVKLDFLPEYEENVLVKILLSQNNYNKKSLLDLFGGVINKKLANELINEYSAINNEIKGFTKNLSENELLKVIIFIKNYYVNVVNTNDYLHSQICKGGVSVEEIDSDTMESKVVKNLYFSGEFIDVDGLCGGYNLQWAWTTGYIAGRNIAND